MQVIEAICDEIIIIDRGIIVANAPIDGLKSQNETNSLEEIFMGLID